MNNNKIRRTLTSLFVCAMTGVMLIPAFSVSADTKIEINEKNFPDKYFREALKNNYDDGDGYLSSELEKLDLEDRGIEDLTGIELLPNLEFLNIRKNELTSIDLSKNTNLSELWVEDNELDKLDLSKNTELEILYCNKNHLKTLDISNNTKLSELYIQNNELDKLDLSKNTELAHLNCGGNHLETLDLSKNTKLGYLEIDNNKIKTIDLSKNTELNKLNIENNKIDKLDLSKNTNLKQLYCGGNLLETLDLSFFPNLRNLDCSKNAITSLDIGPCPFLRTLRCNNNKLASIDLSANPDLMELYCQGNRIDKLDVSGCKYLVMALEGTKYQENGYVVYYYAYHWYELALDDSTIIVKKTQITIDDKTKQIYLDQGTVVSLGFEGTDDQTQVKMTSSNDSIVKIIGNNTLDTGKAGSSVITAKVGNKKYKFKVTVYFDDVKDNTKFWFVPTYALTEKGVVKGYDNQTSFKPANKCTRAQMVTFIWRLMGSPEPETKECKFSDVKKSDYFYKACLWGNENHIVEGYKDGTFGPYIVCARRHAVTFLWRLAGKPEPKIDKITFTDVFKDINEDDYFYEACLWASEKKIVEGYSDNTFRPDGDCLRRQMVTFLYKFDKYVGVK